MSEGGQKSGGASDLETPLEVHIIGTLSSVKTPVELFAARIRDREDPGLAGQKIKGGAGNRVEARHSVHGDCGCAGIHASRHKACAKTGEGGGAGSHADAIKSGGCPLRRKPRLGEHLGHEDGDGLGVVSRGLIGGARQDQCVVDECDGGCG